MFQLKNIEIGTLAIMGVISLVSGVFFGEKFDEQYRLPASFFFIFFTFILMIPVSNAVFTLQNAREHGKRLTKFDGVDVRKSKKKTKKDLLEQMEKVAISYEETKLAPWMRYFIKGGFAGVERLKSNLAGAGIRGDNAIKKYIYIKILATLGLGVVINKFFPEFVDPEIAYYNVYKLIAVLIGSYLAWFQVTRYVREKGRERAVKIGEQLPVAIDVLSIYVSSGVPFDSAINHATPRMQDISPLIASEFINLARELSITQDRIRTFDEFLRRNESRQMREFISIVKQADRDGTPMSQAFAGMSKVLRKERMLLAEQKAAKIPTLLLLPQIAILLPAFVTLLLFSSIYELFQKLSSMGGMM